MSLCLCLFPLQRRTLFRVRVLTDLRQGTPKLQRQRWQANFKLKFKYGDVMLCVTLGPDGTCDVELGRRLLPCMMIATTSI